MNVRLADIYILAYKHLIGVYVVIRMANMAYRQIVIWAAVQTVQKFVAVYGQTAYTKHHLFPMVCNFINFGTKKALTGDIYF